MMKHMLALATGTFLVDNPGVSAVKLGAVEDAASPGIPAEDCEATPVTGGSFLQLPVLAAAPAAAAAAPNLAGWHVFSWVAGASTWLVRVPGFGRSALEDLLGQLGVIDEFWRDTDGAGQTGNRAEAATPAITAEDYERLVERAENSDLEGLQCPIDQEIPSDPVMTVDGQIYNRASIERWFQGHNTSPSTNLRLNDRTLTDLPILRQRIEAQRRQQSEPEPES